MLTVYRIENDEGYGPFNGGNCVVHDIMRKYNAWNHPNPHKDGIKMIHGEEICGCISMQQLDDWFPEPCRQKLEKHGFRLKTFVVEDAKIGKHQVVFRRS